MAKAEESKEPDEQRQRQKTLVFDAEIPVSPLVEKRGGRGEDEKEREREGETSARREERREVSSVYTPRQQPNSPRSGRIIK